MKRFHARLARTALALLLTLSMVPLTAATVFAQTPNMAIYDDQLENGWLNWSWATVNLSNPSPVHAGSDSISVAVGAYQALYLDSPDFSTTPYSSLDFWINGGSAGGQRLQIQATLGGVAQTACALPALEPNTWIEVRIPLSVLDAANAANFDGFWIQDTAGGSQPTFYVDDITLLSSTASPPPVTISVDAGANTRPISPLIYGVAFATTQQLEDLNATLNRSGGNNETRYNWEINAINLDNDWYFESVPGSDGSAPGADQDAFFSSTKTAGATAAMTVPMLGWVANLGPNRSKLDSFSVAKYGAQQAADPYWPDAGNGVSPSGTDITGNDPNDADVPSSVAFQTGWINHMISTWGTAANGGLSYYLMDNEPSIWFSTHRDVHPNGAPMEEIYNDIVGYGGAVKAADPTAQVMGPEEWGWTGYFYSGEDQQYGAGHGWGGPLPDRTAHNNMDYVPWLLQQLQSYQNTTGTRLLDVLSLHFYPPSGEYGGGDDDATDLLRNRSTRQLWDSNYVSESWIGAPVYLIPRMRQWVNTYYPGTKTAITEYNWGDEDAMNGATTQADILGIFGEYGLNMATRWGVPDTSGPTYQSLKMYRNYDGNKSTFGDTSVSDTTASPDIISSYAATRSSDGALTIMVIDKCLTGASTPVTIDLANFPAQATAQVWQLSSANPGITELPDVAVASNAITFDAAPQTVTLFIVPQALVANPVPTISSLGPVSATDGTAGFTLTINGSGFTPASTVTFGGQAVTPSSVTSTAIQVPITSGQIDVPGSIPVVVTNPAPGGGTATASFTVKAGARLQGISLAILSATAGATPTATVTLTMAAPAAGAIVQIASSNPAVASVPATSVTVPAGARTVKFKVTTYPISVMSSAAISATLGITNSKTLTVKVPALKTLTLSPTTVAGGGMVYGTVTLTSAPLVNTTVLVTSGNPAATIAGPVVVLAGQTSAGFTVATTAVSIRTRVSITASAAGVSKTGAITITK